MNSKEIQNLLILLVISVSIFSLFYFLKFRATPFFPTYDEYQHIIEINKIRNSGYTFDMIKADLIYPLDFFLSFSRMPVFLMRFIPFLFGLLNIGLIYLLLKKTFFGERQILVTSLFIIFSPMFIYSHITYTLIAIPLFFVLSGALSIFEDKYFLALVFFLLCLGFNPRFFIIIFFVLIVFLEKFKAKHILLPLVGMIIATYFFISINMSVLSSEISLLYFITNYISDLGAPFGIGIFSFILGGIGILFSWENKKENAIIYYLLFALFICSLVDRSLLLFVDITLAYYSGIAFMKIWKRTWESSTLKNYVILLIFCGVIFSAGSYLNRFAAGGPTYGEILSLNWLNNNSGEGNILSYYKYGYIIGALTGLEPYTDESYFLYSKDKLKIKLSEEVFNSRNLKNITNSLNENNITYIWINEKMKKEEVWRKKDEGLHFVLQNSIAFKKIYSFDDVEIWKYNMQN